MTQTKLINKIKKVIGIKNIGELNDFNEVLKDGFMIVKIYSSRRIFFKSHEGADNSKTESLFKELIKYDEIKKYVYLDKENGCFYYICASIDLNEVKDII